MCCLDSRSADRLEGVSSRSLLLKHRTLSSMCGSYIVTCLTLMIFLSSIISVSAAPPIHDTHLDRIQALYAHQVQMGPKGEPYVSVKVSDRQRRVLLESKGGLIAYLGADHSMSVHPTSKKIKWEVKIKKSTPGEMTYWVIGEQLRPDGKIEEREAFWRDQGYQIKRLDAGSEMSIKGQALDTRQMMIVLGGLSTYEEAEKLAQKLEQVDGRHHQVIEEPLSRSTGVLTAKYGKKKKHRTQVTASDVIWFSSTDRSSIKVTTWEVPNRKKATKKKGKKRRRSPRPRKRVESFDGDIYITLGKDGRLDVVNSLNIERILEGVVPSEIYNSAPLESLKTQAIAARGQLLVKVGTRHRGDPYHFCSKVHCQVYTGLKRLHHRTSKAVLSTRGLLAFDPSNYLIDTVYSSTCGGHTEAYHEMWGGSPQSSLLGVVDNGMHGKNPVSEARIEAFITFPPASYCQSPRQTFRWKKRVSGTLLSQNVNKLKPIGPVYQIKATRRGVSGRAIEVKYFGTKGELSVRGEYRNRVLLGRLRSGLWLARREGGAQNGEPKKWHFQGGGYGHGVGMCQHGAIGMARGGAKYPEILSHYYHNAQLKKLW